MKINILLFAFFLLFPIGIISCNAHIRHDVSNKTILVNDQSNNLSLLIDYSSGCRITQVNIKGMNKVSPSGVFTAIRTDKEYDSRQPFGQVKVTIGKKSVQISNIIFADNQIRETWTFTPGKNTINWTIRRIYERDMLLEDMSFPAWNFSETPVWKGGIFDNGGMVWCKYFRKNDAYGVHTAGVTFWNPDNNHALRITPTLEEGLFPAAKYSRNESGEFVLTQYATSEELKQRYQQERFTGGRTDVFAPFKAGKGEVTVNLELQYIDYETTYSRGTLPGIDAVAVRELMNTTARYGVVDNNIIGANGWITNWKCLHEPFFAQIGLALNDPNYTRNFSSTLNQERDLAMLDDGRVLSRWHGVRGDEIPGTYNDETGYYEAMWGYTIDSQTGYIINTAEQFNLCGDINWLKSHKISCEKALNWLIRRDSNGNGIFEMMNNNIREEKASDWIDIVWASFENAFVNAQMYEALKLWAACEQVLGDREKSEYYLQIAQRLKTAFNKPVSEGGFWYPEKKQYIYWRDNDGSIHGDNIVTPVNFAAIAYGICDDPQRISEILGQIETRTSTEKLFHWPLCFDSYKREEVQAGNWPFPRYENGDIFPTWGYLGIRAYLKYDKALALKYIHNILKQYNEDGLSSQRYSRTTQKGLGSDILSGICTTITALYSDIYGIQPKWNRMGLEPNMSEILNGTGFSYLLRDTVYHLKLNVDDYEMFTKDFSVKSKTAFGASMKGNTLYFYPDNKEKRVLCISAKPGRPINLEIKTSSGRELSWTVATKGNCRFQLTGMDAGSTYQLLVDNKPMPVVAGKDGVINFSHTCGSTTVFNLSLHGN